MASYIINGPAKNFGGSVKISGSKNAALPIMAAAMLSGEKCVLKNLPRLSDTDAMAEIMTSLGCSVERKDGDLEITADIKKPRRKCGYELFSRLRASVLIMAPLLARFGRAKIPMPGGCKIGARPIDLHLKGFSAMGAKIRQGHGMIDASAPDGLSGCRVYLDFPSVGATENLMTAACLANGTTVITNAANEPEIVDLAEFLNKMGAVVSGAGSDTVTIEGVSALRGCEHKIIPDRIEAGTFLVCAAGLGAGIRLEDARPPHLKSLLAKLSEMGADCEAGADFIELRPSGRPKTADIKTMPYPGFPTDLQAQATALLATCEGSGMVVETIFENRFAHIPELRRMGAGIKTEGNAAFINGVRHLSGAEVSATDLRAGAALVTAALKASGKSVIHNIEHIERGYENFTEKLRALGADIERTD